MHTIEKDISTLPEDINLTVYHGDTWAEDFELKDDATTAHDLTSATATSQAVDTSGTATDLTVTVVDASSGTLSLSGDVPAGTYTYDLQVADGADVLTWARGQLEVESDVTT